MFFVIGIGVAVFIEFLLISKKNKSESDNILTVWMFLILIHLFSFYLFYTGDIYKFPSLLGIGIPLPLIHGICLYFYVGSLTDQLPKNKSWLFLHFIPIAAAYVYLISFFTLTAEQKVYIYKHHGVGYELFQSVMTFAIWCSGIFYVTWSVLLLKRHKKKIQEQFSNIDKINLRWLQTLTIGFGGLWFLVIFFGGDVLIFSGVVIFIFLIGFFGVRQTAIFSHGVQEENEDEQKEKYQKSGLTDELSQTLHQKLTRLMIEEALYRKSDLSITDLASRLNIHPNYLSQVINEKEGKNFYDFINTYRIEEFKRLIAQPKNQQLTLLSVAFDCGFNSKSSFNRFFKKATGKTPSEYFSSITGNLSSSS